MRPRNGEVLALAGIAYSAPQPPGSVFKIITLAGALEAGVAKPSSKYPVETAAVLEGVELENANGESCGGTLQHRVRPLVQLGLRPDGRRARRPASSSPRPSGSASTPIPALAGAMRSTIPAAAEIGDDLAVGSTAIGQGKVLATPLRVRRASPARSASAA